MYLLGVFAVPFKGLFVILSFFYSEFLQICLFHVLFREMFYVLFKDIHHFTYILRMLCLKFALEGAVF